MNYKKKLTYSGKRINALLTSNKTKDLFDLFHADMPTAVIEHMEKNLHSNNPWQGLVMVKYDGVHFEWEKLYITHNSHNSGFIGYLMPADQEALLTTIFEYSCLKQHELSNRLNTHIKLKNMALEPISA